MRDFLELIVKNIVDLPDKVVVDESEDDYGKVVLSISVDKTDMGKIIGKEGRIIKAVRDLVKILAVKANRRVNVQLTETD
ncbi:hypothetical protein A2872_01260 [Candidatus Gottesmanbacteria bacterium RIFCSPHIGHO2_01_FULL_42_12]|uniref:RNA-binding protein KhpA n=1 Tax=Candidatus Gottesmanbacteria bacterium RIFCSPHIGHO2_01_FULL_42_12 TaxID=1798377 RepID=A0A1F5Z2C9_9BACT|nr:MAG: hypothetical protein A2872_01260 [Candidatus Gottesmanbacteria bacterium RIFCSPHIGHO2_01_FULL_42_12]